MAEPRQNTKSPTDICRKRKIKCIIESDKQGLLQSSCTRCKRELRHCTFSADRRAQAGTQNHANNSQRIVHVQEGPSAQPGRDESEPLEEEPMTTESFAPVTSNSTQLQENNSHITPRSRKRPRSDAAPVTTNIRQANTQFPSQTEGDQEPLVNAEDQQFESVPENTLGVPLHVVEHRSCADGNRPLEQNTLHGVDDVPAADNNPHISRVGNICEPWTSVRHSLSTPSQMTLDAWNSWPFVKSGWITAQEAVTYVDLFFQNMSILSPIIHDYYYDHTKHRDLITKDPVLCCTIIALSARYHILAGDGGISRGYYIHDRLWKHCQFLFQRIVWNQRRAVKDQIRYLGTIESYLLVTEWHPRSAHLPMDIDYCQPDIDLSEDEQTLCRNKVPNKWLQEVEETAERSDRMSWMLLGSALTLGNELDLFDDREEPSENTTNAEARLSFTDYLLLRRGGLRRLLFVYISQLASRIGCALPKTPFHDTIRSSMRRPDSMLDRQWHDHMTSWIELSRLIRTSSEFLFPSKPVTQDLLRSGRYTEFLEHFQPLLSRWLEDYTKQSNTTLIHHFLLIDYQFVRLYINSLALQAVAGRMGKHDTCINRSHFEGTQDFGFIREVINGSKEIMEMVIKLARDGHLKYIPVRIYIRIASASMHLINALALGVRRDELDRSLSLLDRTVGGLYSNAVDDVHLGFRYASLLRNHTKGLRQRFVPVRAPISPSPFAFYDSDFINRKNPTAVNTVQLDGNIPQQPFATQGSLLDQNSNIPLEEPILGSEEATNGNSFPQDGLSTDPSSCDDWFTLPFNASNDDFGNAFMQSFFEIDPVDERFFWDIT